jgi:hypothetical protein
LRFGRFSGVFAGAFRLELISTAVATTIGRIAAAAQIAALAFASVVSTTELSGTTVATGKPTLQTGATKLPADETPPAGKVRLHMGARSFCVSVFGPDVMATPPSSNESVPIESGKVSPTETMPDDGFLPRDVETTFARAGM